MNVFVTVVVWKLLLQWKGIREDPKEYGEKFEATRGEIAGYGVRNQKLTNVCHEWGKRGRIQDFGGET
jgi:hypothetical protein